MTTYSNHHVSVFANTLFPHEAAYRVFCVTCDLRRGYPTLEAANKAAEEHRAAHPYVMTDEVFEQRVDVITRALGGMDAEQLEEISNIVNSHLTNQLQEEEGT